MRKYFHIFGVQRTATTFTTNVVIRNTVDTFVITDHKHRDVIYDNYTTKGIKKRLDKVTHDTVRNNLMIMLNDFERGAKIYPIVVIKNPYSWFQSISWWVKDTNKDFDVEKWYGRYNKMYKNWKELLENPIKPFRTGMVSNYENLLRAPKKFLNHLRNDCGVELKEKVFITDRMASQRSDSDRSKIFSEERKRFYLQDGNFGLSKKLRERITELVDWDLMKFYGYKPKGGGPN